MRLFEELLSFWSWLFFQVLPAVFKTCVVVILTLALAAGTMKLFFFAFKFVVEGL